MARGLSRRGVHELPNGLVLRATWRTPGLPGARGGRTDARPRSLERARLPAERAIPRLLHLQPDGVRQGAAVLRAAAVRRGRRDDAPHPAHLLRPLEAQARGRGLLPGSGGGSLGAGLEVAVRPMAAWDAANRLLPEARAANAAGGRPLADGCHYRAEGR